MFMIGRLGVSEEAAQQVARRPTCLARQLAMKGPTQPSLKPVPSRARRDCMTGKMALYAVCEQRRGPPTAGAAL